MNKPAKLKIFSLAALLVAVIIVAISKGSVDVGFFELFSPLYRPILFLRLTRIMLAALVGAGLGVCGVVLQAVLRNPLAEPYLLGSSSGAGCGAVLAIIIGIPAAYLPFAAFIGALASIVVVYTIAREGNKIPVQSLILSGVIIAVALSGLVVFLVSTASGQALHNIMWWLLGNMQIYDFKMLGIVAAIVLGGIALLSIFSQDLNAISLGEEDAIHLGIEIDTIKKVLFLVTSLITGALVSLSGMIGFVGLIIPHMMRFFVGPNHKVLIPATALGSAAFLIVCDAVSRSLFPPVEIPIGVITSLIGAPIFIILLKRKQKIK